MRLLAHPNTGQPVPKVWGWEDRGGGQKIWYNQVTGPFSPRDMKPGYGPKKEPEKRNDGYEYVGDVTEAQLNLIPAVWRAIDAGRTVPTTDATVIQVVNEIRKLRNLPPVRAAQPNPVPSQRAPTAPAASSRKGEKQWDGKTVVKEPKKTTKKPQIADVDPNASAIYW